METGQIYVIDTNVLVHDQEALHYLNNRGLNEVVIPLVVISELDGLKKNPLIAYESIRASKEIEKFVGRKNSAITIADPPRFTPKMLKYLDAEKADHRIIATAWLIQFQNTDKKQVVLVSNDRNVRIMAKKIGLKVEDYQRDKVEDNKIQINQEMPSIEVDSVQLNTNDFTIPLPDTFKSLPNHSGVILLFPEAGHNSMSISIRRGSRLVLIDDNIQAFSVKPYDYEPDKKNSAHFLALAQLLDRNIYLNLVIGEAGTGKTLLAIASALEMRAKYQQILITRPVIAMGGKDRLGYLPGKIEEKMSPWLQPIYDNLDFLKSLGGNNGELIDRLMAERKIEILSLDHIRGRTLNKRIIIVDEAQNLRPEEVKTIVTRAGLGSKFIFTGDLTQIDSRFLDQDSNGLAYLIHKMIGKSSLASFVDLGKFAVRSPLAREAVELLV